MSTPAPPTTTVPLSPLRWWVCLLLMQATVVNYMDRMALNQMALRIQRALNIDDEQYSWFESAFSFAFAIGAVTTGIIVDKVSVRWVYPIMVLGWSAAGVLTGFATGFWFLLACRFALGFFEAGNWPCGLRTTRAILPPVERSFGNSLFQGGTALGAVLTPPLVLALLRWAEADGPSADSWKFPFRVIGSLGVVWVVLWFATVPRRMLNTVPIRDPSAAPPAGFSAVFRDPRFWVLFVMTVAINVAWHGYRTWLPLYLQKQRAYTEVQMSGFTTVYYLVADIGAWTIGLVTLWLCSRGVAVHTARVLAFASGALLTSCTVAVPFLPNGWALEAGLLAVAFGALGLFATYYSLSQEISATHQGKVTGTLGACAHLSLALIYPIEGRIIRITGTYELVLGAIGLAPLLAFAVLLWNWRPPREGAQ